MSVVRAVTPQDYAAATALVQAAYAQNPSLQPLDVSAFMQYPHRVVFGVYEEAQLVGCIAVQYIAPECEIIDCATHPAYQRRGIAHTMFAELMKHYDAATQYFLEVAVTNHAAIALYTSLGFKKTHRRKAYYNGIDALVMRK